MLIFLDMGILFAGWLLAQVLFNGYEAHVPITKRASKFVVLFVVFFAVRYFIGRVPFYSLLVLMTLGIGILHGYWFHFRHGIHWRTAEPRDRYLALIGEESNE
jgi:hypothetical protein